MKWKILMAVVCALLLYNSVYFEKLSVRRTSEQEQLFDAVTYARDFWDNRLPTVLDDAVDVNVLLPMLGTDMNMAIEKFGNRLGIGNVYYYLVKGEGVVKEIGEEQIVLEISQPGQQIIALQTDFIFGNAIRDASGLVNVSQFVSTMEFNSVSSEVNKIVRDEVVSDFVNKAEKGNSVKFIGACEVDRETSDLDALVIIPVRLEVIAQ